MRVNSASSNAAACSSCASGGGRQGRSGQVRSNLQAGYNDRLSALRSEFHEARRAAAGDPARLADVHAQFKERKSELKVEAESRRTELRNRWNDRKDEEVGESAPSVVAAAPEQETGGVLNVVA